MRNRILKPFVLIVLALLALVFGAVGTCGVIYTGMGIWGTILTALRRESGAFGGLGFLVIALPAAVIGLWGAWSLLQSIRVTASTWKEDDQ